MNVKFFAKIEIFFWDVFVRILSDSRLARKWIKNLYSFSQRDEFSLFGKGLAIAAVSGLFFGITLYILVFYFGRVF